MARTRISALFQALTVLGALSCLGVRFPSPDARAENGPENALPLPEGQKSAARFVPPPDPSSLPSALLVPPQKADQSSLDLLPSFPTDKNRSDSLDLILKKRANPTLVPDGPNPTEDAAVSLDKRHRYQTARYRAMNDPEVQEALVLSQTARTDRQLREALRRHYTLLFARMRKLDSTIESLIQEREAAALGPLQEPSRVTTTAAKNKAQP